MKVTSNETVSPLLFVIERLSAGANLISERLLPVLT